MRGRRFSGSLPQDRVDCCQLGLKAATCEITQGYHYREKVFANEILATIRVLAAVLCDLLAVSRQLAQLNYSSFVFV